MNTVAIILYRLFLWLYRCGAIVLSPFNLKAKHWLSGRENVLGNLTAFFGQNSKKTIWCHCASLGEFEQARPLLESLRAAYPGYCLLLSFFSPSGYEIRKNYRGVDFVTYLPMDSPGHARQLLAIVKPSLVLWVKYEYWHFYLQQLKKENIPVLLISGIFRQDQLFFKPYGGFYRNMLSCFTWLFVQTQTAKKLLGSIGFSANVAVSGDTRFDRVTAIAGNAENLALVEAFIGSSQVIVAGSTWQEDEEELDHFANIHPEIKFIIAPHEIDEDRLKDIEKLFQRCIRYSVLANAPAAASTDSFQQKPAVANVLLIDNIGMLATLYKYATVAYVGGGFGDDGVHNVLEAAVYGKPVVFGPVYEKFAEAVELEEAGGAFAIENALELEATLEQLLNDNSGYEKSCLAARNYVYANTGATQKILSYIQENRLLTN